MNQSISLTAAMLYLISSLLPASAFAHVTMQPKEAPAESYAKLTFRVPHGCNGSPTTKITVRIPEGVLSVKPQVHPGWKIATKTRKIAKPVKLHGAMITESVSEVSWSGLLSDEYMDEFGMSVKLPAGAGSRLLFPVEQECKKGTLQWAFAKASGHGENAAQLPAPALRLTQPSAMMGMGHR
jgi:uncharacterized protein YcnI